MKDEVVKVEALKNDVKKTKSSNAILVIYPSISGISGDMLVAALVSLLESKGRKRLTALEQEIVKIDNEFRLTIEHTERGAFSNYCSCFSKKLRILQSCYPGWTRVKISTGFDAKTTCSPHN